MSEKKQKLLLGKIIRKELDMFLAVNSRGGKSPCQDRPESFCLMREITHGVLPESFLESYLHDLQQAEKDGRNFMTEKYALMESLIPPLSEAPQISEIVDTESEWRRDVSAQFPRSVQPDGHEGFCLYLGCELQTYSPKSLKAYLVALREARTKGRNLVRERYELLMQRLGYGSLEACEARLGGVNSSNGE